MQQECPSVEDQPPTCSDLDLDPMTFTSELDLDMVATYLHAKN